MSIHICGVAQMPEPVGRAILALADCCLDAIDGGPAACTCWVPVFDVDQAPPDRTQPVENRPAMCDDCAYRPDSPERTGDERYRLSDEGGPGSLRPGEVFWCHQGMRKPTGWRHPAGVFVPADVDAYDPPIIQGVPYRADGAPGLRCAGWAARELAASARGSR